MSLGFPDPLPPFATLPHKRSIETRAKTMSNAHWIEMGDVQHPLPWRKWGACAGMPADALTRTLMATYDIIMGFFCPGSEWQCAVWKKVSHFNRQTGKT